MAVIQSGASADLWTIEGPSKAGRVLLYDTLGQPIIRQHLGVMAAADSGAAIVVRNDENYRIARGDRLGNLGVSLNNMMFNEPFEGSTPAQPNRFTISTTNFVQVQSNSGGFNFNSTNLTTAGSAALVVTNRRFARYQRAPLHFKARARVAHVNNAVAEFGFGNPAAQTASPTVGAFWQVTAGGVVQGVMTFNGVDVTTAAVTMPAGWQNNFFVWDVILDDDEIQFVVQNTTSGQIIAERRIQIPETQARTWDASRLSAFARLGLPTAPATAANLIVTGMDVVMTDMVMNKPWAHVMAHNGQGAEVVPTTASQPVNYANSAAPATSPLSNTLAAYTNLGGQFAFAALGGAETDYIIFGYTVPAPFSFICTGIDIDVLNTGAAVATTPTVFQWFASPDQTAVSLATATNRRITLGLQSMPVATPIGGLASPAISRDFSNGPLVTNAGRFFVIGLKMPVATATPSQVIRGIVSVRGYFE